jgi:hypothetical protein
MNVGIEKEAVQFHVWEYINQIFVTVKKTKRRWIAERGE